VVIYEGCRPQDFAFSFKLLGGQALRAAPLKISKKVARNKHVSLFLSWERQTLHFASGDVPIFM